MISLPSRYSQVIKQLNGGGMSETIVCCDSILERNVVIKALKPGIASEKLQDELSALSSIRSRFVVQIYDVIADAGGNVVGFVEEYLDGPDLTPCTKLTPAIDTLRLLFPIASAITEIHDHQRVHRDIKPDNMKFDHEGQLKIFDFGLAKHYSSNGTANLFFSPGYTAPECFFKSAHGKHTYSAAVDVYAFGCVAIWLLSGGILPRELLTVPPTLPIPNFSFRQIAPQLPVSALTILTHCIEILPSQRPSMGMVRDIFGAEILRDRHRLILTLNNVEHLVDANNRNVKLTWQTSSATISYSGIEFSLSAVAGTVLINNRPAAIGQLLKGSSVIVLGIDDKSTNSWRASITCDVSHPEVMI